MARRDPNSSVRKLANQIQKDLASVKRGRDVKNATKRLQRNWAHLKRFFIYIWLSPRPRGAKAAYGGRGTSAARRRGKGRARG
jgi:hypothetical protein